MGKPEWDESQDGPNPVLADLADPDSIHRKELTRQEAILAMSPEERLSYLEGIQAEAVSLANSRGASLMTPEQHFLNAWQTNARVAAASLHVFRDPLRTVENREERVSEQRYALATALYKLGRTQDALMLAEPFPVLIDRINWIQAAVDHDDSLEHNCPRQVVGTVMLAGHEVEQKANRRTEAEQVFSERHGALVHVWECSVCGDANATVETPERQARDASLHAQIDATFKAGKPLTRFEAMLGDE